MESESIPTNTRAILDKLIESLERNDSQINSLTEENKQLKENLKNLVEELNATKNRDGDLKKKMQEVGKKMKESFDKVILENNELKRKLSYYQEITKKVVNENISLLKTLDIE